MDSARKQTAIVVESVQGTTPTSPGFKLLRDTNVTGAPSRTDQRSPERGTGNRMATNMTTGLVTYRKTINMPWVRDAGTDILLASLLNGAFSTDVLVNGSTPVFFTLEEKYEGGSTDPYRRLKGCMVNSATFNFQNGQPGSVAWQIIGLTETLTTTALGSATYAAPTPGYDPVTPADILVNNMFSLTTPKMDTLSLTITNNLAEDYSWGSPNPDYIQLGDFDVTGSAKIRFSAAADYSTFMTRQTGLAMSVTVGSVANYKDTLEILAADVYNPDIDDPGRTGTHKATLAFMGKYDGTTGAIKITRLVA